LTLDPDLAARLEERIAGREAQRGAHARTRPSDQLPCVLVADDDPEITRSVRELLTRDYHVLTANTADEALALLEENEVSVILTDQRMPGGTGAELLARALDIAPETTRVLFTGYSDISAVIEAVNRGQVYRYLAKPWRPEELSAVVGQGLERYQLTVENRRLLEEITQANQELAATNRELHEFAYSMAHDLRSPLRALDGFSLALLDDYGDLLDEAGKDYLGRIRAASQRMAVLFDAQLALARSGHLDIELTEVDLTAIARRLAERLSREEPLRDVTVAVAEGMTATTDETLAELVLERLLDNAWKFTSKKSVAHIEIGREDHDGEAVYFVRDDGAGFDDAYVDKLFRPFERLHSADDFAGAGVGLASVRRMLARLGGRCWAEGEVGSGAVVWFTLAKAE
jgi:signal transduction histidine kinase